MISCWALWKNEQRKLNLQNNPPNSTSTGFFAKFKDFFGFSDDNDIGSTNPNKQVEYENQIPTTNYKNGSNITESNKNVPQSHPKQHHEKKKLWNETKTNKKWKKRK